MTYYVLAAPIRERILTAMNILAHLILLCPSKPITGYGTKKRPWNSIAHAERQISGGDKIVVLERSVK